MGLVMLCSLFHFFGDWCVEGMWGGGHGVVILGCGGLRGIRGIGVIVIVYWEIMGWWCLL